MLRSVRLPAAIVALLLLLAAAVHAGAVAPGNAAFQHTWERTDQPVISGSVARTWIWGPEANSEVVSEPYAESPGGARQVQYYDKSRMEINNPAVDPNSLFYVTNGLLVVELMTGDLQLGDNTFEQHAPAVVNVAGDADDPTGPTYATFGLLRSAPPAADRALLTLRVDRSGVVTNDPSLASQGITAANHVSVPGLDHQVASPFWTFMNSTGLVYENGANVTQPLFQNPFYATGYPVTEAYWASVKVGGTERLVLMQCFERRCLTYTPGNPAGFATEAGNVGQHYHTWRYVQLPGEGTPTATGTSGGSTATATSTAPATATATVTSTETATPSPPDYYPIAQFGGPHDPETTMVRPHGIAVDPEDGSVYVADRDQNRVQKYSQVGQFIRQWGSTGSDLGQFNHPYDVAVDRQGIVYVVDAGNRRIQTFNSEGEILDFWSIQQPDPNTVITPIAIAVSGGDVVYVVVRVSAASAADLVAGDPSRVQMFDLDGGYLGQFGSDGDGPGQFDGAADIAVAPSGAVYVVEQNNNRVQYFTPQGVYDGLWSGSGSGDGQFNNPTGIAVSDAGSVYVADYGNHRIQAFDDAGGFLDAWGSAGTADDQFDKPVGIAVAGSGATYVTDESPTNPGVKVYSDGDFLFAWHDDVRGTFDGPIGIDRYDVSGTIIVIDSGNNRVEFFAPSLEYLVAWDGAGDPDGRLSLPVDVAAATDGTTYFTEALGHRVRIIPSGLGASTSFGSQGNADGQFQFPQGVAVDDAGVVYVGDAGRDVIQKFSASGAFLASWGEPGSGQEQLNSPAGMAVVGTTLYVADTGNNRVVLYRTLDGAWLGELGSAGDGPGEFDTPTDVAVDKDGFIFVVDSGNDRIQKFTPDGEWITSWGESGSGFGQFQSPSSIVVDADGEVYVTDRDLDHVVVFVVAQ